MSQRGWIMDKITDGGANGANDKRVPDMPDLTGFYGKNDGNKTDYTEIISALPKTFKEKLTSGYDMMSFAKIFEDEEMMRTADAFLNCGLNVSRTARVLYMHRNTLIYRLGAIRRQTGLDLRDFTSAVNFKLLHYLYILK